MATKLLIEKIASCVAEVPGRAAVLALRQQPLDELDRRARRLLAAVGEAFELPVERGDWVQRSGHTLVRMPRAGWASYQHASGAMRIVAGLEPMADLFERQDKSSSLVKLVDKAAARLNLREFIARNAEIHFERLWSIKATAAGREGKTVDPVLCRIVGAYRHYIGEIAVWGPASIALKLAGGGKFDSLAVNIREASDEIIDRPKVVRAEQAAEQIAMQLETVMGRSKIDLDESTKVDWARFGYLALPGRKAQSVLAPVYIASISITGQEEAQGYVLATSATDKTYMSLAPCTSEAPSLHSRTAGMLTKEQRVKTIERLAGAFGQVAMTRAAPVAQGC